MMVTVIIPAYNRASIIKRSIDSVLNQTWSDLELIIVDDASTDNLEEVIREYTDKRIKYIRLPNNQGACHARNIGIDMSMGKYIAFQDSDDYWFPKKLEKQMDSLLKSGDDLSICRMVTEYVSSGKKKEFHDEKFSSKDLTLERELAHSFISTQLLVGKRECFEQIKFDEKFPRFQDWDLGIRMVEKFRFSFVNEVLVTRYVDGESLSTNPGKGFTAGQMLLDKHHEIYGLYPKSKAKFLEFYAQQQELYGVSSLNNLVLSLKLDFQLKTFIKLVMQVIGVYRLHLIRKK